jgi:hypothetical protein
VAIALDHIRAKLQRTSEVLLKFRNQPRLVKCARVHAVELAGQVALVVDAAEDVTAADAHRPDVLREFHHARGSFEIDSRFVVELRILSLEREQFRDLLRRHDAVDDDGRCERVAGHQFSRGRCVVRGRS